MTLMHHLEGQEVDLLVKGKRNISLKGNMRTTIRVSFAGHRTEEGFTCHLIHLKYTAAKNARFSTPGVHCSSRNILISPSGKQH